MFYRLLKWITEKCDSCFIETGQFNTTSHFAIYYRNDTKPLDTRAVKYKNAEHPDLPRFDHKTKQNPQTTTTSAFFPPYFWGFFLFFQSSYYIAHLYALASSILSVSK